MHTRTKMYLNGQWSPPEGSQCIEVTNPATEEIIGTIPAATAKDAARAVEAASSAAEIWAATSVTDRGAALERVRQGLIARADELAQIITAEVGMPSKLSRRIQVGLPLAVLESYIKLLANYQFEERIANSLIVREPAGVATCITPWNYPLHQVIAKVIPALAAGCTVVLKPSEVAPFSAFILAEIIDAANLPPGAFNLVSGCGDPVGEALACHPSVDLVSFTGSVSAGRRVAELAAKTIKRVTLELGGKSAAVLLNDADLPAAVKSTVGACFFNSGQTCTAHTRLLVPEHLYEQAVELAIEVAKTYAPGDPQNESTRLGPLVSSAQRERVRGYIQIGINEGAELLTGGMLPPEDLPRGFFVQPTIFGRVTPGMTIAQEEIFGPVLAIMTYRDEEEAIQIANGTPYGLAAAVWSTDASRAMSVARRLTAGQVDINGAPFNLLAPFGGCKQSGYGRELGRFGMEEYQSIKAIQLNV